MCYYLVYCNLLVVFLPVVVRTVCRLQFSSFHCNFLHFTVCTYCSFHDCHVLVCDCMRTLQHVRGQMALCCLINKILVIFNFINSVTIVLLCSFGLAIPCENCTCKLLVASLKLAVPLFTSFAIMLHKMAANFNGVSYEMLSDGVCAQNKCNLWSMFVMSPFSMRVIKSSWMINFKSCNVHNYISSDIPFSPGVQGWKCH